jgi:hypothetical protein
MLLADQKVVVVGGSSGMTEAASLSEFSRGVL